MAPPSTSHVFISYSRRDETVMRRVVAFLRKQSIIVWLDNEKLVPGTPIWEAEIEEAIFSAGAVVVLLSPDSKNSPWVRREISYAEDNDKRIFPIFVAGNPRDTIPIRLTNHQRIDIRENEEVGLNSLAMTLSFYLEDLQAQEKKALEKVEKLSRSEEEKRRAAEKIELERLTEEKAEHLAKQKAEEERIAKAKIEAERIAEEKAERLAKQKADAQRIMHERSIDAEHQEKENAKRFAAQTAKEESIAKDKIKADEERKVSEKDKRLAHKENIGRKLFNDEFILFIDDKVCRRFLLSVHYPCKLIMTNIRLIFWDPEDEQYSFEITHSQLSTAKFKLDIVDDIIISLLNGHNYKFGPPMTNSKVRSKEIINKIKSNL